MEDYLRSFPQQVSDGLAIGQKVRANSLDSKKFKKILYCGMGGSAISGDILKTLFHQSTDKLFIVHRASTLPKWIDEDTFIIFASYSGNTLEVNGCFDQAIERKLSGVVLSSGGKLLKKAEDNNVPSICLPGGFPPRCALGYIAFSLLGFLNQQSFIHISDEDLSEVSELVKSFPIPQAESLAKSFYQKNIRFYSYGALIPVSVRWKTQFAENAKILSGYGFMPEIFHHEVEGWQNPKEIIHGSLSVFFRDSTEPEWMSKKIEIAKKWMQKNGADILELKPEGKSLLARMFSLIVLGDWTSYELAKLNQEDPLSIIIIDDIKASEN